MITVTAVYSGGRIGRFKGEPMYGSLKVKIKHGKIKKN